MRRLGPLLLVLAVALGPSSAEVELVLRDGRVLAGQDVTRKEGQYLLVISEDEVMSIPVEWVTEVRLSLDEQAAEAEDKDRPMTGHRKAEPETLAGSDPVEDAPTGIRVASPESLAGGNEEGEPVKPPTREEALEVLGEPAEFSRGSHDPYWRPKSVFTLENDVTDFNPSSWSASPIDPQWQPDPAFTLESDVTDFNPSIWQESLIDSTWTPVDARARDAEALESRYLGRVGSGLSMTLTISAAEPARSQRAELALDEPGLVAVGGPATPDACVWCPRLTAAGEDGTPDTEPDAPVVVSGSGIAPSPRQLAERKRALRACAAELFRPLVDAAGSGVSWRLRISTFDGPEAPDLPIDVHQARLELEQRTHAAVFTLAGDECRLINAEPELLGWRNIDAESQPRHSERVYNEAVTAAEFHGLATREEKLTYAVTVAALVAPLDGEPPRLVESPSDFERILSEEAIGCPLAARQRRRESNRARGGFSPPTVTDTALAVIVKFVTWSPVGGLLVAHTAYISPDGAVAFERDAVAICIGNHRHPDDPRGE